MAGSPEVLLLDDGELDDIQAILDSMGTSYGRVRGAAIAGKTPAPSKLLVTTPRRMDAVPIPDSEGDRVVRIVVVNEDSPALRAQLRDVGFDYLVRRPVHPEALRLMLLRCLFSGAEQRREARVPVGLEVSYRMGLLPKRALLADLSTRGCRILSKWAAEPGKRITLTIPPRAGVSEPLGLRGRVVRMTLDEHLAPAGPYAAAVEFETLTDAVRTELEWILEERARGPAQLGGTTPAEVPKPVRTHRPANGQPAATPTVRPKARPAATPEANLATTPAAPLDPPETRAENLAHDMGVEVDISVTPEVEPEPVAAPEAAAPSSAPNDAPAGASAAAEDATDSPDSERRESPRAAYERRIPAFGERAMRVLVARDLSMGGMRVQKESGLEIGDRLHLAIYGSAEAEPFLVWACVERDDGDRGLLLAFDPVPDAVAKQLDQVVVNLPAVESLHDDELHAMGTVVSEILLS